jgi:hypothetical protein
MIPFFLWSLYCSMGCWTRRPVGLPHSGCCAIGGAGFKRSPSPSSQQLKPSPIFYFRVKPVRLHVTVTLTTCQWDLDFVGTDCHRRLRLCVHLSDSSQAGAGLGLHIDSHGVCWTWKRKQHFLKWLQVGIGNLQVPTHLHLHECPSPRNGSTTHLVPSLHLWACILGTPGIFLPQVQLWEVQETTFGCSGKGKRGLAGEKVPKSGSGPKWSIRWLVKPKSWWCTVAIWPITCWSFGWCLRSSTG